AGFLNPHRRHRSAPAAPEPRAAAAAHVARALTAIQPSRPVLAWRRLGAYTGSSVVGGLVNVGLFHGAVHAPGPHVARALVCEVRNTGCVRTARPRGVTRACARRSGDCATCGAPRPARWLPWCSI